MEKFTFVITVGGCDDTTQFDMELTPSEAALLAVVAARSQQVSTYKCMPTLHIDGKVAQCSKE